MKKNGNRTSFLNLCKALHDGLTALANADPLYLGDKTYAKADVLGVLQTYILAMAALAVARQASRQALQAVDPAEAAAKEMVDLLKPYLQGRLGKDNAKLETYGFAPLKPAEKTAATKASAAAKSNQTRKALHTMGSKQRKTAKKQLAAPKNTQA